MKRIKLLVMVIMFGIFISPWSQGMFASEAIESDSDNLSVEEVNQTELKEVSSDEEENKIVIEEDSQQAVNEFVDIMPASANMASLKALIESATADITINLDPGIYEFDSEINNTLPIKVTLIGAVDVDGKPATQFTMATTVTGAPRFVRVDAGTLDISNVEVAGTEGVNGGVSARNVVSTNCVFEKNYTNDSISGVEQFVQTEGP